MWFRAMLISYFSETSEKVSFDNCKPFNNVREVVVSNGLGGVTLGVRSVGGIPHGPNSRSAEDSHSIR